MKQIILILMLMITPNDLKTSNSFRKSLRKVNKTAQAVERAQYADNN